MSPFYSFFLFSFFYSLLFILFLFFFFILPFLFFRSRIPPPSDVTRPPSNRATISRPPTA